MMGSASKRLLNRGVLLLSLGLFATACSEDVVFVERPIFTDPPTGANGFLGYQSSAPADEGMTVCGNCHVGTQRKWAGTHHSGAWETLEATGHAQDFCRECHSTGPNGNPPDNDATEGGWVSTGDTRYYDVQCEACHGPGEAHVENPDRTQPLASAAIDTTFGCGDCHQGNHHGFVNEWLESPHARIVTFAADNPECAPCHRGQTTLLTWGEDANYVEKDDAAPLAVVCVVCHNPHGSENEHQLRFPVETTAIEEHLCARCHDRRTEPDPNSSHGLEPHAPESALLVGNAGWFPPGAIIEEGLIRASHGTERNATLCAACHVFAYTVNDSETGDFVFEATGHLFRPIPCVDAQGVPEPFEVQCGLTPAERSYLACTESGCHGSVDAAFSALTVASGRVQSASDDLLALLEQVDPGLDAPGGEIDANDPIFTVAEGAFFNYNLSIHGNSEFGTNSVIGSTVHNPFLMESLLLASIQAVEDEYGVSLPRLAGRDWNAELQAILTRAGR